MLEIVGIVTVCVIGFLIIIPIVVGAVQFWIYYVKLLQKVHGEKKHEPPAAA